MWQILRPIRFQNLDSYETVVVLMSDLEPLKEGIIENQQLGEKRRKCHVCHGTAKGHVCVTD